MINLDSEYYAAERAYDLSAFDNDPDMAYELTLCYSTSDGRDAAEDVICVKQTIGEIKDAINGLTSVMTPETEGLVIIAYGVDDSHPTPAYLVVRKDFHNVTDL